MFENYKDIYKKRFNELLEMKTTMPISLDGNKGKILLLRKKDQEI